MTWPNGTTLNYGQPQMPQQWGTLGAGWGQGQQPLYQAPIAQPDPGAFSTDSPLMAVDTSNLPNNTPGADTGGLWGGGNLWGALGSTNEKGLRSDGWGGLALGATQGLAGAFFGAKQYQAAQSALSENKRQFNLNFENQRKTVNTELEDRQRARVASNAGAYQSVGDYMQKNGV